MLIKINYNICIHIKPNKILKCQIAKNHLKNDRTLIISRLCSVNINIR